MISFLTFQLRNIPPSQNHLPGLSALLKQATFVYQYQHPHISHSGHHLLLNYNGRNSRPRFHQSSLTFHTTVYSTLTTNTHTIYATGLLHFTQFCDSWEISEDAHMPASQALIVAFVAQCTGAYDGNTVHSWLAGVRSWHIINGAPWNSNGDWVHLAQVAATKAETEHRCLL